MKTITFADEVYAAGLAVAGILRDANVEPAVIDKACTVIRLLEGLAESGDCQCGFEPAPSAQGEGCVLCRNVGHPLSEPCLV